jgi:hypothetical protein
MKKSVAQAGGPALRRRTFFGVLAAALAGVWMFRRRVHLPTLNGHSTAPDAPTVRPHPSAVPRTTSRTGSHG